MAKSKGIYKRPGSPYWWIRWTGADGKQKKESAKTILKTEAEYLLSKRRKEAMEGVIPEKNKKAVLLSEFKKDYLVWAEHQRAYDSKAIRVDLLIKGFGDIPLSGFSTKAVEQYQAKRLKDGRKPATVNKELATLKHMLSKAVEWEMVTEEAVKGALKVKLLQENNRRLRYLSKEECGTLLNKCASHLKPMVVTALNTGMRRGEIFGLTWDRVDLKHGFILLDITKNGERREIPINATLRAELESLAIKNIEGRRFVFHEKDGKPFDSVKRSFNKACKDAGITDFHFHDLRHTFASQLVMAGIDLTTVKELMGHKDIKMTLRYAHLAPSHKVKALEVLDQKMGLTMAV
jgi:integrase